MKKYIGATLAAGAWINLCEFLRNELVLKQQWLARYTSLGLEFPSAAVNGILWIAWGFLLGACIVALGRKLDRVESGIVVWTIAFPMMWIVAWNLGVLPLSLLPVAVPWSVVEVAVAVLVADKIAGWRSRA